MQIPIQPEGYSFGRNWRSLAFSVFTHLLMLGLLLLWVAMNPGDVAVEPTRAGQIVLAEINDDRTEYLTEVEVSGEAANLTPANMPRQSVAVSETPPPLADLEVPDFDLAGATPVASSLDVRSMANQATNSTNFEYRYSKSDLESIEADRQHFESLEAAGPPTTISIFGSGALTGRKFVLLIDRSKSMGEQGLRVLRNATSELINGIQRLEENHYFQIVAYNDHITSMQQRGLLRATAENKQLVPPFMTNLMAFGGTNHRTAIYSALSYHPDVILILNDGGFPELNAGQIAELGRLSKGTRIHVLHFGLGVPVEENHFMKQLAETCSGSYRYIDVRKWQTSQGSRNP